MERILVHLGEYSYNIIIASGLLNNISSLMPLREGDKAMLITNETLAVLYLDRIYQKLKFAGIKVDSIILPDGEKYKNLTVINNIFTELLNKSHDRDTTLVAIGGGVIGDLTGFAASLYKRGVNFIQIPTTLLSQVDSSIGGKVSVNHQLGKNMIGAFYQPRLVVIDLDCLKTLPIRELISGFAEVIKYGIILDKEFFVWLEENIDGLLNLDSKKIEFCIRHCCELKANLIAKDEHENNKRTLLNLGHTYGHAIEAGMGYGNWLHGEAVSVGIVMAARTSELLGKFTIKDTQRIIKLFKRVGLPVTGPIEMSVQAYLPHIMRDKKILSGQLRMVLPITIGKGEIYNGISKDIILNVLSYFCQKK